MAITTYGDLLASRRHYLHQPGGEAIGGISQTTPDGWRSFADCYGDARRLPGRGGLGVAFVHGGLGEDGGSVCFFDGDYKPFARDGDTAEKRAWFAAAFADFRAMFEPSDGALAISRSGKGRHLVGVTADEDRADFAAAFEVLGKKAEVVCPLDAKIDAKGKKSYGVKIEFWDWVGGNARSRFLTGRWRGEEPSADTPLPTLSYAAFRSNPHIARLIETPQSPPQEGERRNGGGSKGSRSFGSLIQPYLEAGGAAVLDALLAKGLRGRSEREGGMRFRGEEIGCHIQSGGNAGSVQVGGGGDALAHCHSGCSQERLWAAIHGHLGWLPTGQKACRVCGTPHKARFDTCRACKPQSRSSYSGDFRPVFVQSAADIRSKIASELERLGIAKRKEEKRGENGCDWNGESAGNEQGRDTEARRQETRSKPPQADSRESQCAGNGHLPRTRGGDVGAARSGGQRGLEENGQGFAAARGADGKEESWLTLPQARVRLGLRTDGDAEKELARTGAKSKMDGGYRVWLVRAPSGGASENPPTETAAKRTAVYSAPTLDLGEPVAGVSYDLPPQVRAGDRIALDLETSGFSPITDRIVAVLIHKDGTTHISRPDAQAAAWVKAALGRDSAEIVTHNGNAFDLPFIHRWLETGAADVKARLLDTLVLASVAQEPHERVSLEILLERWLGVEVKKDRTLTKGGFVWPADAPKMTRDQEALLPRRRAVSDATGGRSPSGHRRQGANPVGAAGERHPAGDNRASPGATARRRGRRKSGARACGEGERREAKRAQSGRFG